MDNGASSYHRFREKGDNEGLAEIIKDYKDGMIFYLNSFVNNVHTAEELAINTFVLLGTKKPKDNDKLDVYISGVTLTDTITGMTLEEIKNAIK